MPTITPSIRVSYLIDAALGDPDGFISGMPVPVIIDETQRAPDLMRAIKGVVDRDCRCGHAPEKMEEAYISGKA